MADAREIQGPGSLTPFLVTSRFARPCAKMAVAAVFTFLNKKIKAESWKSELKGAYIETLQNAGHNTVSMCLEIFLSTDLSAGTSILYEQWSGRARALISKAGCLEPTSPDANNKSYALQVIGASFLAFGMISWCLICHVVQVISRITVCSFHQSKCWTCRKRRGCGTFCVFLLWKNAFTFFWKWQVVAHTTHTKHTQNMTKHKICLLLWADTK